ncbi:MAG: VCBS repeat-containing protein, partial [Deltaproteobacteria bacterium]|nr:VCBS repeat-containing protein [Deltaproteobacteria bacterium]
MGALDECRPAVTLRELGTLTRERCKKIPAILVAAALLRVPSVVQAQSFADVSATSGLDTPYATGAGSMASGAAAADFDDDGWVDVFLPTAQGTPNRLYRNRGDGTFQETAALVGLDETTGGRAALWFDYDGDGDLDLLVAGDCTQTLCSSGESAIRLYQQGPDGHFAETSVAAGLFEDVAALDRASHRAGLAAGDLTNNGYLDLYAGMWGPDDGRLLLNQGDGSFVQLESGNALELPSDNDWQPVMHDFNGDGWMDLFVAVDFTPNRLWLNQQNGTFIDVAVESGVGNAFNEMGVALGDYDGDGDFDIYITNIFGTVKHN